MINQRIKILLLTLFGLAVAKIIEASAIAEGLGYNSESLFSSPINSNPISLPFSPQSRQPCQKLGQDYQKVSGFSTNNFYIGICSQGEQFYYYRQSKFNPKQEIFLKATAVLGGDVFKATKGKVTYFVGTNAKGYYSSVMQPNHEIIVEPEIKPEKFNLDLEKILNMSPDITEETKTSKSLCSTQKISTLLKGDEQLWEIIKQNPETKKKDAILYSSSC